MAEPYDSIDNIKKIKELFDLSFETDAHNVILHDVRTKKLYERILDLEYRIARLEKKR